VNHDVTNQPPPLAGSNAWRGDPLLVQLAESYSPAVRKDLDLQGRFVMNPEAQDLARLANSELPRLRTHDRHGRRLDQVEFHPAYHALMRRAVATGLHSSVWENGEAEVGRRHQVRAARFYLTAELECGHLCPITMTSASLAALMASPKLFREWAPRVTTRKYDHSQKPPVQKGGLTLGMGMTEKQGGTDVRANTTRAERAGGGFYRISGHKWFMSAPMCDAFLMLAQAPEGLSCFLVPRILGDGNGNGLHFQRLKDKLGNRSNASAEVEIDNAIGEIVGEPGAGVRTIMDMVTLTRLDCAVASSGLMRAGLAEAIHHTRHREVFGKKLVDQPLMQRVLADMALDVAAATALSFRLARAFDEAADDRAEASFARAMTPVVKYWVCKTAPPLLYEAMECLGGNGYVEEAPLARYYREAPVNAIWEGSGNVMCLDVLRALSREADAAADVLRSLVDQTKGLPGVVEAVGFIAKAFRQPDAERIARLAVEKLALVAAAAALNEVSPKHAELFAATRLAVDHGNLYGAVDLTDNDIRGLLDRALPA
jgi:putative acyl-CoA dehydrogenase